MSPGLGTVRVVRAAPAQRDHRAARAAAEAEAKRHAAAVRRGAGGGDGIEDEIAGALADGGVQAAERVVARRHAELLGPAAAGMLVAGLRAGLHTSAAAAPADLKAAAARAAAAPLPDRAAAWAERRAAALVTAVTEESRAVLRRTVAAALRQGAHARELAARVRPLVGLTARLAGAVENRRAALLASGLGQSEASAQAERYAARLLAYRADMIARTESFRAVNEGRRELWQELVRAGDVRPGDLVREWVTARDERVDDICEALDGEEAPLDGTFAGGYFEPPDPHPSCLPGEVSVQALGVRAATVRWYEGDLVIVRTASGERLACTPQHPVLTRRGWVPARELHRVGHLLRAVGRERMIPRHGDNDHGPAPVEQVAEAFRRARGVSAREVPVAAPDFHGDGAGSEVAVVWSNRHLMPDLDAAALKLPGDQPLKGRGAASALHGARAVLQLLRSHAAASARFMGALGLAPPLALAHAGPFQALGLALPAWHDPDAAEAPRDPGSRDAERLREGVDRVAGPVEQEHVVGVDVISFRGHVHNLQTAAGWYLAAGGIVTQNCRCTVLYRREEA